MRASGFELVELPLPDGGVPDDLPPEWVRDVERSAELLALPKRVAG